MRLETKVSLIGSLALISFSLAVGSMFYFYPVDLPLPILVVFEMMCLHSAIRFSKRVEEYYRRKVEGRTRIAMDG